jgi:hypothetical protein
VIKAFVGNDPKRRFFYLTMSTKIITVEVARQKLGKRAEKLTDKQVSDILVILRVICNKAIDGAIEEKAYYEN